MTGINNSVSSNLINISNNILTENNIPNINIYNNTEDLIFLVIVEIVNPKLIKDEELKIDNNIIFINSLLIRIFEKWDTIKKYIDIIIIIYKKLINALRYFDKMNEYLSTGP